MLVLRPSARSLSSSSSLSKKLKLQQNSDPPLPRASLDQATSGISSTKVMKKTTSGLLVCLSRAIVRLSLLVLVGYLQLRSRDKAPPSTKAAKVDVHDAN